LRGSREGAREEQEPRQHLLQPPAQGVRRHGVRVEEQEGAHRRTPRRIEENQVARSNDITTAAEVDDFRGRLFFRRRRRNSARACRGFENETVLEVRFLLPGRDGQLYWA